MAFRLIPREEKFYADFLLMADELQKGARLLVFGAEFIDEVERIRGAVPTLDAIDTGGMFGGGSAEKMLRSFQVDAFAGSIVARGGIGLAPDIAMVTFPTANFLPSADLSPVAARKTEFYAGLTKWVSTKVRVTAGRLLSVEAGTHDEALAKANDVLLANLWGDGLPLWPATRERVACGRNSASAASTAAVGVVAVGRAEPDLDIHDRVRVDGGEQIQGLRLGRGGNHHLDRVGGDSGGDRLVFRNPDFDLIGIHQVHLRCRPAGQGLDSGGIPLGERSLQVLNAKPDSIERGTI